MKDACGESLAGVSFCDHMSVVAASSKRPTRWRSHSSVRLNSFTGDRTMHTRTMDRRRSRSAPLLVFMAGVAATVIGAAGGAQGTNDRPDVQIDAAARSVALSNLAKEIETNYPYADVGKKTAENLRARLSRNSYQQTSAKAFASTLTEDLRALTGDQHFQVDYFVVPRVFPPVTEIA